MDQTVKKFSKGDVIFDKGQVQFYFYEIISGSVFIYSDYGTPSETLLAEMKPGQTFGELGLLGARPRSAAAVAASDTELLLVDSEGFEEYLRKDPEKVLALMKQISERTRSLTADYNEALKTVSDIKHDRKSDGLRGLISKFAKVWGK